MGWKSIEYRQHLMIKQQLFPVLDTVTPNNPKHSSGKIVVNI